MKKGKAKVLAVLKRGYLDKKSSWSHRVTVEPTSWALCDAQYSWGTTLQKDWVTEITHLHGLMKNTSIDVLEFTQVITWTCWIANLLLLFNSMSPTPKAVSCEAGSALYRFKISATRRCCFNCLSWKQYLLSMIYGSGYEPAAVKRLGTAPPQ